ncbi:hypothetical protein [Methylobacterium segetis]|uniref:hypothetical protein n=1 Tax=Methylobacterium segetis TaxID=2488750 RepID=UPI00104F4A07|nr:hypothetical protein [Methylobacterium segetis]
MPSDADPIAPLSTAEALAAERDALGLAEGEQPAALCLSGGGVRSAAFCLGVLQALAARGLLGGFHYLSTVSGGGYIGAFLTRLISGQLDDAAAEARTASVAQAEAAISGPGSDRPGGPVHALRRFTSFLAPEPGLLSLDTLTGILLWLRNTLINWFVLLPVFVALAAAFLTYAATTAALVVRPNAAAEFALLWLGGAGLLAAVYGTILGVPSHSHPDLPASRIGAGDRGPPLGPDAGRIRIRIIVPILVWCFAVPLAVAPRIFEEHHARALHPVFGTGEAPICPPAPCPQRAASPTGSCPAAKMPDKSAAKMPDKPQPCPTTPDSRRTGALEAGILLVPALSLALCLLAYALAFLWEAGRRYEGRDAAEEARARRAHVGLFRKGLVPWVVSALASAGLLWWGIWLAQDLDIHWLVLLGPLWFALAETLRTTAFVALRRNALRGDLDREWLARLNGTKLIIVLGLCLAGIVVVIGGSHLSGWSDTAIAALAGGGAASGGLVAWIGRSALTAFAAHGTERKPPLVPLSVLTSLGIVAFGTVLLVLIGHGTALGIGRIARLLDADPSMIAINVACVSTVIASILLAWILGRVINLNRFSMHAVYRSRLIRGFLGPARRPADQRPDRFTGFDPLDNLRVTDAFTRRVPPRLVPVINVALNRTRGFDPAQAERKADSFTITPLHCGSAQLRRSANGGAATGAYVPTDLYAGDERQTGLYDEPKGISLGTAMTISGAAASPNMGYHSSALTAFVMTLFNVRLGAWLPNPGAGLTRGALKRAGPRHALPALLSELIGRSRDDNAFVYLSDGGHFDNLGLYEMLRRRCSLIVVVDAGQDEAYAYGDLARAIQYAGIDLGVAVEFPRPIEVDQSRLRSEGAFARITYPARGDEPAAKGRLLYLKPWLSDPLPIEVAACAARRKTFPHDPTLNQFFSESDFENYRRLGAWITDAMLDAAARAPDTRDDAMDPAETDLHRVFNGAEVLADRPARHAEAG